MSLFHALLSAGGIADAFTNGQGQQVVWVIGDSHTRSRLSGAYGPTPTAGTVYQFYSAAISQIGATDIQQDVTGANWGSIWPEFGIKYFTATARKPVFALSGIGGTTWAFNASAVDEWANTSTLYADSKVLCDAALAAVGVQSPKYIVIALGNNDAFYATALATIQSAINQVLTTITTDYPNSQILIVQNGRLAAGSINSRIITIRGYLVQAARDFTNVYIAGNMATLDAVGSCFLADNIHMTQTGNNHIGDMLGKFVALNPLSYSKWARSIISNHFSELSTARKDLILTFVTSAGSTLFDADFIGKFKAPTEQDTFLDFSFLTAFYNLAGLTFTANSHISSNGSSTWGRVNFNPTIAQRVTQNDISAEIKIKANRSTTFATAMGGGSATTHIRIGQTNTVVYGRIHDITTTSFGESDFVDDNSYRVKRTTSTAKTGDKSGAQVASVSVTSIAPSSNTLNVGSMNITSVASDFMDGDYEWAIICKPAAAETLRAAMETLCDNW